MDQVHTGLGGVQFLLYALRIRVLQGAPPETVHIGHSWADCFPY